MPATTTTTTTGVTVKKPAAKFAIGAVASVCGVLLPKLAAFLGASEPSLKIISFDYIVAASAFSVLVGVGVMFKEWGVDRQPWDTFMTALGLPAVVAGVISGHSGAQEISARVQSEQGAAQELSQAVGIPIRPAAKAPGQSWIAPLVAPVYAAAAEPEPTPQLGVTVVEPHYWVVVGRAPDKSAADQAVTSLQARLTEPPSSPSRMAVKLEAVRYQNAYLIVEKGGGRRQSEALNRALEIKRKFGVMVELQEVPKSPAPVPD
jgi:hypothetical protein